MLSSTTCGYLLAINFKPIEGYLLPEVPLKKYIDYHLYIVKDLAKKTGMTICFYNF